MRRLHTSACTVINREGQSIALIITSISDAGAKPCLLSRLSVYQRNAKLVDIISLFNENNIFISKGLILSIISDFNCLRKRLLDCAAPLI